MAIINIVYCNDNYWHNYCSAGLRIRRFKKLSGTSDAALLPRPDSAMDLRKIAQRAGVSLATASRAINHIPTVNRHLSRRVWKVVYDHGYYPNTQARALVSGKSKIFGLIVSNITNPFFQGIVEAFETIAVQHKYEILLTSTAGDPGRIQSSVRRMLERRVDGVAALTFDMEELLLARLKFRGLPLVLADVDSPLPRISRIRIDYLHGIRQAVQHLAALGHRRIAFITGPLRLKSALARRDAVLDAFREIDLSAEPHLIVEGDHTIQSGVEAAEKLLRLPVIPTAILCSNDLTAIGLMRTSYEKGVVIPQDLSLVGFDDIPLAQFVSPPLTTVQMSQSELARLAFTALLTEVARDRPTLHGAEYILQTNIVLRNSTARIPHLHS